MAAPQSTLAPDRSEALQALRSELPDDLRSSLSRASDFVRQRRATAHQDPLPTSITALDRVLGADILYQRTDHAPILRCIDRLLTDDGVSLLADPCRSVADRFESMATEQGFEVQLVPTAAANIREQPVKGRIFRLSRPSVDYDP